MESSGLTRKQVAREVNREIALLARSLDTVKDGPLGFFCECGCWEIVAVTVEEYRLSGAWADGHAPAAGAAEPTMAARVADSALRD